MELFDTENENRNFFLERLTQKIHEQNLFKDKTWNFMIDKEIPVPYRHIYFPVRNELEICCFKQDICIYTKLLDKSITHRKATITVDGVAKLKVVLNKNAPKGKDIGLPFVIIETKMLKNTDTHTILAYCEKTKMIKSIFPYCMAYLLCFGDGPCKNIYRLASGFDELLYLKNLDDKNCADNIESIIFGFNNAAGKMAAGM